MKQVFTNNPGFGLRKSPWIILGTTAVLIVVVVVMAVQNTRREQRYMSEILSAKGAAMIRAVEAGARTGMMGMQWGGHHVQRLLEETARLPDVLYMAVVNQEGMAVAHSDPDKIDQPFRQTGKLIHLGPELQERWELVQWNGDQQSFEIHRHFRPLTPGSPQGMRHGRAMMRRRGMINESTDDWFALQKRGKLLIVAGLDVTPFEEAIRKDIRTTMVLSAILLLLGFGAVISLFWMHSYRAAKRSLRDTSAFADEVVAHLPVGLIATDASGRISFFNAAAERITGVSMPTAKGQVLTSVLPANLCSIQETLDQGGTLTEKEMNCIFAKNERTPVSVSATRIINDVGDHVGQVLILRDLGDVRRLEDEVRRQEKLAAIGGLAAGVAHEIRNPLSSIKGLAVYFGDQFDAGSDAKQAADVMVQEVDRLNRAITELMEFAGPTDLKPQSVDLNALIARSVHLIQNDAANQNIQVDTQLEDTGCRVWIDPDRLAQCLLNLYLNAIEAMETSGRLTIHCRRAEPDHVHIDIVDTGCGIPPEQIHQIFDPYFTTKKRGTGLGLAIVNKIIQAHQARLEVSSTPERGTTMTLIIPCHNMAREKRQP